MIVRLHNLSSRPPTLSDVQHVAELIRLSDTAIIGQSDVTVEQIRAMWRDGCFDLKHDAWVIVTRDGHIVGYAAVQQREQGQLRASLYVHPQYRGRGIGTLLIWLAEERARYLMLCMNPELRVTLSINVNHQHESAVRLLERENYALTRSFWRVMVDTDTMSGLSDAKQSGKLSIDLILDAQDVASMKYQASMYVAQQYDVYEKELRSTVMQQVEELCCQ